jgi:hypothetical protein
VAAERQREGVKAAFMIPTKVLSQAWSMLGQFVHTAMKPKPALSLVQQAKARTRQKTLESLIADYENTYNQLNYTSNAAERNMIKRQCDVLEQEMTEVANVLDAL